MTTLRKKLAALLKSLEVQTGLHQHAVRRMKARHVGQKKAEKQAADAHRAADKLLGLARKAEAEKRPALAAYRTRKSERKSAKGRRLELKAARERGRAIFWRGRVRILAKRIAGIETNADKARKEIADAGVTIVGNVAKGGTAFERWLAVQNASVANCVRGLPHGRANFYSMAGTWNIDHPITPGERPGERSDCSQTLTAWAKAAGLPDPNGANYAGGWTGTLQQGHNGWKQVSLEVMLNSRKPAFIIYGFGVGHHVEGWCPELRADGTITNIYRTAGHGSAPVDYGTVNLFGDGEFRCYVYG